MKVFVTHSYFYQLDPKQWRNKTPYPPLGTITALAVLRQQFDQVAFYDVALDASPASCISVMKREQPHIVVIYEDGFNYLTKMCLTNMRDACFVMMREAKSLGATVIVSGSDATDHYALYHENGANFILHGEGEFTLSELTGLLEQQADTVDVKGISYINAEGTAVKNPMRVNARELDELPDPAWDAIDIPAYKAIWRQGKFPFTLNISTTRGCPFKCNWCAKPIYGNRYNSRSPERVVDELKILNQQFGAQHIWMTDDIFGLKPGWVKRFNELIQEAGLNIRYKIQSRADLLLAETNIEDLAASGLEEAWIGAESGSQKILDAMDKGITLEQIRKSTKLLHEKGVRVAYFLQFGYLGETKEDIQATLDMVTTNRPDDIGISVSYPLPGTKFHERVKEEMGKKTNWTDSDDLDMMFAGTYSADFYRKLQRYVHHSFRARQGLQKWAHPSSPVSWRYALLVPYNLLQAFLHKSRLGK